MGRLGTAFRAFLRVLKDGDFADRVTAILDGKPVQAVAEPVVKIATSTPVAIASKPAPKRSDALTLLAVLQREARLIDFLKENIAVYSDDQIGSAVREIHRDASATLDRLFALRPARAEAEGASVSVPAGYDAGRIKLTGNVAGSPPYVGVLTHPGWEAAKVELPEWSGSDTLATVIAPAEIELK